MDSPAAGTTYTGYLTHVSEGGPVQYLIVFSGLDAGGNPVVFDYTMGTLDPQINTEADYQFTYPGPDGPPVEHVEVEFPEANGNGVNKMLKGIGTEMSELSITLLWNAEEDLDLQLTCPDGTSVDYETDAANECGAAFDGDQTAADYDTERGDGSFGQTENIGVRLPVDGAVYSGTVTHVSQGSPV